MGNNNASIQAFTLINVIGLNPNAYTEMEKLVTSAIAVIMIGLVVAYMILALNNKKAGHVVGMVAGAVYILNFSVLSIIVGALFIIYCILMLKEVNEVKSENKEKANKEENK